MRVRPEADRRGEERSGCTSIAGLIRTGLRRRSVRNAAWSLTGEVVPLAVSALYTVFLVRWLGKEQFGIYSFLLSFYAIAFLITDPGINGFFLRQWAREKDARPVDYPLVVSLRGALSVIVALIAAGYGLWVDSTVLLPLGLMFGVVLVEQWREVNNVYLAARSAFPIRTTVKVLDRGASAVLGASALLAGWGLAGVLAAHLLARIGAVVAQLRAARLRFRFEGGLTRWAQLIKRAYPLFLINVAYVIYYRADILILRFFRSYEDVGVYGTAYTFINFLNVGLAALGTAMLPSLAPMGAADEAALETWTRRCGRWLAVLMAGGAVVGSVAAGPLVIWLFSVNYQAAAIPLRILLWAEVFTFGSYMLSTHLYLTNREAVMAKSTAVLLVLNVLLNLGLIPRFGLAGAAAATLVTEVLNCMFLAWLVRVSPKSRFLVRLAACVLIAGGVSVGLASVSTVLAVVVGGLAFAGAVFSLRVLDVTEVVAT